MRSDSPFDGLTIEAMIAYAARMRPPATDLPADPAKLRGVPPEQRDIVSLSADELRERGYVRQPEAIRRAEALVELEVASITLIGPQGSGKSTLAAWLGSQAARRRHREGRDSLLFWSSWADLSAESRQGRPGQTSEGELYARSAPVVVLIVLRTMVISSSVRSDAPPAADAEAVAAPGVAAEAEAAPPAPPVTLSSW